MQNDFALSPRRGLSHFTVMQRVVCDMTEAGCTSMPSTVEGRTIVQTEKQEGVTSFHHMKFIFHFVAVWLLYHL
jgi:hypothetical protein